MAGVLATSYLTLKCFYFLFFKKKMFSSSGMELKICFPKILKKSSEMDSKFPWIATQLFYISSEPLHILPLPLDSHYALISSP